MNFQQHAESILANLKNEAPSALPSVLPVLRDGKPIAQLRVITKKMLQDDRVIALLTKWRRAHQDAFPSQFRVTHAGTKRWGKAQLLDMPDRILFFLETLDGKPYAHLGLYRFDYQKGSCEIDNVIRGRRLNPGSMTEALLTLTHWTLQTLQVKNLYLQVFADNEQAIKLYKRCGFIEVTKRPLKKIIEPTVTRFIDSIDPKEKPDRYFLLMKLQADSNKIVELKKTARHIRQDILRMTYHAKSAHAGGAFSCVELLTALYFVVMRVFPKKPNDPKRDRFIFSKAHDAKALYATLCARGFFDKKVLEGYEQNNGLLPGHSTRQCVPGVEVSAGALGHGLSMAVGMAYVGKLDKKRHKIFALLSDGECDEGSTWEAILFAGHHQLDNLVTIVDYNKLQGFGFTKDILDLEPFAKKWESFGWNTKEIDGHNFTEIIESLQSVPTGKPYVIIAHTIKGLGGVATHVNQISSQYKPPTTQEFEAAIKALEEQS